MLYHIYQIFVLAPIVVIATVIVSSVVVVMCTVTGWLRLHLPFTLGVMTRPDWWASVMTRWWGRVIICASLLDVHIYGRENIPEGRSCVFTANHQGAYDIFLVCGYLGVEIRWMLKRSLEKIPLFGMAARHAGYIFVDKGSAGKVRATYRKAEEALKDGASVMVFPEGARTFDGRMRAFRRGAFTLADELQLPVVPMTINGSFDVLPRQRDGHFIKRHELFLTIHAPIYPHTQGMDNINRLMEESYTAINSAVVPEYRN